MHAKIGTPLARRTAAHILRTYRGVRAAGHATALRNLHVDPLVGGGLSVSFGVVEYIMGYDLEFAISESGTIEEMEDGARIAYYPTAQQFSLLTYAMYEH